MKGSLCSQYPLMDVSPQGSNPLATRLRGTKDGDRFGKLSSLGPEIGCRRNARSPDLECACIYEVTSFQLDESSSGAE